MSDATTQERCPRVEQTTLLSLVQRLGALMEDDAEVVRTAQRLLEEGRVKLTGSFRNAPVEAFFG